MDILDKIQQALEEEDKESLKEIYEHFGLDINEGLGDGVLNAIKKKIKEIEDDCKYVVSMAKKIAKNTGNKNNVLKVDQNVKSVLTQLKDLENITQEMLDYMFGGDDLGPIQPMR